VTHGCLDAVCSEPVFTVETLDDAPCTYGCESGICNDAPEEQTPLAELCAQSYTEITAFNGDPISEMTQPVAQVNFNMLTEARDRLRELGNVDALNLGYSVSESYTGEGNCFTVTNQSDGLELIGNDGTWSTYNGWFEMRRAPGCGQVSEIATASVTVPYVDGKLFTDAIPVSLEPTD